MGRRKAILALSLLVPAPSLGAWLGMVVFPDSFAGVLLFGLSKAWLFGFPLAWILMVDHARISFSPPRNGGFMTGLWSGLAISGLILAGYWTLGDTLIDKRFLAEKLEEIGLGTPGRYAGAAAYWIGVNSVLEEYVWRWFCVKQCEELFPKRLAIGCSAVFFTLHHVVALQVFLGPLAVAICSLGVFIGGAVWSMMYVRYRSVWPGYLSHALADLCVFGIGAAMVF